MTKQVFLAGTVCAATLSLGTAYAGGFELSPYAYNLGFEIHPAYTNSCCSPLMQWLYPVEGWNKVGGISGGWIWTGAPDLEPYTGQAMLGMTGNGDVWQQLSYTLADNTDYSFTIGVGRRSQALEATPNTFQITIRTAESSSRDLGVLNGTTGDISPGTWMLETVSFNSGTGAAGLAPIVELRSGFVGTIPGEVDWDTPPCPPTGACIPPPDTPEPGTFFVGALGVLALSLRHLQRSFRSPC